MNSNSSVASQISLVIFAIALSVVSVVSIANYHHLRYMVIEKITDTVKSCTEDLIPHNNGGYNYDGDYKSGKEIPATRTVEDCQEIKNMMDVLK